MLDLQKPASVLGGKAMSIVLLLRRYLALVVIRRRRSDIVPRKDGWGGERCDGEDL